MVIYIPKSECVTGVVMTDQLRSLDYKVREASLIGQCSPLLLNEVLKRIKPIIF